MAIGDITGKLSVTLIGSVDAGHTHRKYTATINNPVNIIMLPNGEYFLASNTNGLQSVLEDSLQVYVCGILQTNGVHFQEIIDTNIKQNGVGIDFVDDMLQPGDVVTLEWVLKV